MKYYYTALFVIECINILNESIAFSLFSSFSGSRLCSPRLDAVSSCLTMEYIPSGMSKEQWNKMKQQEKENKKKNLGKVGITSFESRSFVDWQKKWRKKFISSESQHSEG